MNTKELLSAAAVLLTFFMFFPYIRTMLQGRIKPHVFSWVIWGLGTFIVFFAQLADGAGLGAWPIGISGLITSFVALLAYRQKADTDITRTDWGFLIAALSALPFWFLTSSPLWAVVILTAADLIGFGPTLRRAYLNPNEESALFFALGATRNGLVVGALEHYSLTTALFPTAVGVMSFILATVLMFRRRALPFSKPSQG